MSGLLVVGLASRPTLPISQKGDKVSRIILREKGPWRQLPAGHFRQVGLVLFATVHNQMFFAQRRLSRSAQYSGSGSRRPKSSRRTTRSAKARSTPWPGET